MPHESCLQKRENFHDSSRQGREQVPASLLQPSQEQHGWVEETEEAEDKESHAVEQRLL